MILTRHMFQGFVALAVVSVPAQKWLIAIKKADAVKH